jgi:hypothetical protein
MYEDEEDKVNSALELQRKLNRIYERLEGIIKENGDSPLMVVDYRHIPGVRKKDKIQVQFMYSFLPNNPKLIMHQKQDKFEIEISTKYNSYLEKKSEDPSSNIEGRLLVPYAERWTEQKGNIILPADRNFIELKHFKTFNFDHPINTTELILGQNASDYLIRLMDEQKKYR